MNLPSESLKQQLFRNLRLLGEQKPYVSFDAIKNHAHETVPDLKDDTLRHYLSEAVGRGLFFDAGKGWYSSLMEPAALDPAPVQPLLGEMRGAFPLLDFTAWATTQLNPWMRHLFNTPLLFVSCARENMGSVHEFLKQRGYDVWLHPGKADLANYVPTDRSLILRPLISKTPSVFPNASPEQVLVDLCIERRQLPIMDESEFKDLARGLISQKRVQVSELEFYMKRRRIALQDLLKPSIISTIFKKVEIMD